MERPKFEEFKRRLLAKPEVRRAYVQAKVRRRRRWPSPRAQ